VKARTTTALIVLLLACLCGAAAAAEMPKGVKLHGNQTVSVSLESADLRAVVTALARTFDINLVGSDKLRGKVTLHLQDVPANEAIEVILKNAGFELVRKNNRIYEVLTPAEAAKVRATLNAASLQVYTLKFAQVAQVAKLLVPNAVPDKSSIAENAESNQLIIRATPAQLADVEKIIEAVDQPLPQIAIRSRIVEINVDRARSLGVSLTVTGKTSSGGTGTVEVDLGQTTTKTKTLNLSFINDRIDAELNALSQKDVAEVLSAPNITTGHGRPAEFKVVNQVPYITRTTRVVDNVTVTDENITFKETGLTLTVTPRALADGKIQMVVQPSVLELTGFTDTDPPAPIIDTRSTKTDVTIDDGTWLVIGGMMRHNEQKVVRGIPVLMHIPLIGWLFRTEQTIMEKSNLVVLITATVLNKQKVAKTTGKFKQKLKDHRDTHELKGAAPLDDQFGQTDTDASTAHKPDGGGPGQ
jgi:protein transport protein HofQ